MTPDGLVDASVAERVEPDWTLVPSASGLIPESGAEAFTFAQTPLFLDPPAHTRFRRHLNRGWAGGRPAAQLVPWTARTVSGLLRDGVREGRVEFMRSVAVRLAAGTLATFFGDIPEWWEGITLEHAELMWGGPQPTSGRFENMVGFQEHIWKLIGERRASPRDDAISRLARDGGPAAPGLRLAEIQTHVVQSAFSNSNVIRLLGVVARTLAGRPDLRERLRAQPARVDDFVSEVLRTSPPLRGVFRRAARACAAGALDVPAGGGLFVSLSRANRDAGRFPDPAALDVDRERARTHLAFGAGIHRCPAAPLATMQAAVVARALCDLPWLRPVESGFEDCSHNLFAGPSELWLELTPA